MQLFERGLRGVIFDCDGVIIDSVGANREFYNRILAWYGLPPMNHEQELYSFMATSRQALEYILPEHLHPEIPKMGREIVNYPREIMPLVRLFPGFIKFVSFLHEKGIQMAVLTNRTDAGMQAVLDFFSLPSYFDPVVTASCGFSKPQTGGAFLILDAWGVSPRDVVYVGDSEVDQRTALAAGMPFAALHSEFRRDLSGDITVENYAELRKILEPYIDVHKAIG